VAVGIVFVSHSDRIAAGLVELAAQMAPTVALEAAGGTDDGGIGTSFEKVGDAIARADGGQGVLLIGDLGSAIMTAETAVELLDPAPEGGVLVLDVPLVEGGVAAAVAAEGGGDLAAVAAAARTAARTLAPDAHPDSGTPPEPANGPASATVVLADPEGLHARPAAELVKLAGRFAARIQVNGRDARSLLGVLALGLRKGDQVRIEADGPDAAEAVDAVRDLLESTPG
jgi:phosphoenolpyruvate---glycerone phosphotransferase subunit DhaM